MEYASAVIGLCICADWNMHLRWLVAKAMAYYIIWNLHLWWLAERCDETLTPSALQRPHCIYAEYMQCCNMHPPQKLAYALLSDYLLSQQMKYGDWRQVATKLWLGSTKCAFSGTERERLHLCKTSLFAFRKTLQSKRVCCKKHCYAMHCVVKQSGSSVDAVYNFEGTLAAMWD